MQCWHPKISEALQRYENSAELFHRTAHESEISRVQWCTKAGYSVPLNRALACLAGGSLAAWGARRCGVGADEGQLDCENGSQLSSGAGGGGRGCGGPPSHCDAD